MNLLFLPIDIDLSELEFSQEDRSIELREYNPYWSSTPVDSQSILKNNFDKILNQLPFNQITTLTHKIQQKGVESHIDVYPSMTFKEGEFSHIKENEPCGYRFVLKGLADSLEIFNGQEWITASLPDIPCCYLLNSTSAYHRVKEDPNRETIYVRGFIDSEKHKKLINRSYKKYNEHAIILL
jgi:hypothetical protein